MLSENNLLAWVSAFNADLPGTVAIPPGDDMAAVRIGEATVLVAVDQVIDGRHFVLAEDGPAAVGRKAMARNLSDVAAMAAVPVAAVVSASLPRGMDQATAEGLLAAVRVTGAAHGCPVVGGDISVSDGPLTVSVTVLAEPAGVEPVTRGPAQPGEALWVSGVLGGSGAGHHLDFEPRLELARTLCADPATRPTAMMDLSDGLAADLPRLCGHAEMDVTALPLRVALPAPAWQHGIGDGEDYELLFSLPVAIELPETLVGVRLTRIGRVVERGGIRWLDNQGSELRPETAGWEHQG